MGNLGMCGIQLWFGIKPLLFLSCSKIDLDGPDFKVMMMTWRQWVLATAACRIYQQGNEKQVP